MARLWLVMSCRFGLVPSLVVCMKRGGTDARTQMNLRRLHSSHTWLIAIPLVTSCMQTYSLSHPPTHPPTHPPAHRLRAPITGDLQEVPGIGPKNAEFLAEKVRSSTHPPTHPPTHSTTQSQSTVHPPYPFNVSNQPAHPPQTNRATSTPPTSSSASTWRSRARTSTPRHVPYPPTHRPSLYTKHTLIHPPTHLPPPYKTDPRPGLL